MIVRLRLRTGERAKEISIYFHTGQKIYLRENTKYSVKRESNGSNILCSDTKSNY